jgi:hypothetical protein
LGFDLYGSLLVHSIVTEAVHFQSAGVLHQSASDGVSMQVAEFYGELVLVANIAVVISLLPEVL